MYVGRQVVRDAGGWVGRVGVGVYGCACVRMYSMQVPM